MESSRAEAQGQEFTYATNNGTITLKTYTGGGGNVSIPEMINGLAVTAIDDYMMWGWFPLTVASVVTIPKSVTNIGSYAFYDFPGLFSISIDPANPAYSSLDGVLFNKLQTTLFRFPSGKPGPYQIPASVTNIGPIAFTGCSDLFNVTIPDSVVFIERAPAGLNGVGAFSSSDLTSLTIPASITNIPDYLFAGASLQQVALPAGLSSISSGAFWGCASLTSVIFPTNLTSIERDAFSLCSSLSAITIPDSVTNIGSGAFGYCSSLAQIKIPGRVSSIGSWPFYSCTNLGSITVDMANSVYVSIDGVLFDKSQNTLIQYPGGKPGTYAIPDGVANIADLAFYNSAKMTAISIPSSVTSIGLNAFNSCASLTMVVLPDKLTFLNNWTFGYCWSLTNVTLPKSLTAIGTEAFYDCRSLTSVTIPGTVTNIGNWAFDTCYNLTAVYFEGNAPTLEPSVFWADPNATVYYLPDTTGWGPTFGDRPTALWNPQANTMDGNFGVRLNRFGFNVSGTTNIPLVIEASTNLAPQSWIPVQSCTLTNGLIYFKDPQWTNHLRRFYRIRSP